MSMSETVLAQLSWRYAVKKFDPSKKISDTNWKILEESLRLAPSSYGLQPWKFYVIKDPAVREQLKAASFKQSQVTDSSDFVVFVYKPKMNEAHIQSHLEKMASVQGVTLESLDRYKKNMIDDLLISGRASVIQHWAERQVYIAMGMIMTAAAVLKIDTCPMEGLLPAAYDKILNLEGTGWSSVAAIACGYRSADDAFQHRPKVRFDAKDVIKYV